MSPEFFQRLEDREFAESLHRREVWTLRNLELLHGQVVGVNGCYGSVTMKTDGGEHLTLLPGQAAFNARMVHEQIAAAVQKLAHVAQAFDQKQQPSGYPANWPRCPACGASAMDGHITCGRANCAEGAWRG